MIKSECPFFLLSLFLVTHPFTLPAPSIEWARAAAFRLTRTCLFLHHYKVLSLVKSFSAPSWANCSQYTKRTGPRKLSLSPTSAQHLDRHNIWARYTHTYCTYNHTHKKQTTRMMDVDKCAPLGWPCLVWAILLSHRHLASFNLVVIIGGTSLWPCHSIIHSCVYCSVKRLLYPRMPAGREARDLSACL